MGHKSNPVGLRLQINRTWDSRWFADSKDYGNLLLEDLKMRDFIHEECKQAGVSKVIIERLHDLAEPATRTRTATFHHQVLAAVGFGNHQLVNVEAVVVFSVGNGRLQALQHVLSNPLFREGEVGNRLVHLLAADQTSNEVQLLRRGPKHLRFREGLILRHAARILFLTHGDYFLLAFLSAA
jgi:hypothetical protein